MPRAVIEDWDRFAAFLAAQPLCQWSFQKQQAIAQGLHVERGRSSIHPPPAAKKGADSELADALASMA